MAFLLALLTALASSTPSTAACSCSVPPPDEAAASAEAVFVGVVTELNARRPWWDDLLEFLEIDRLLNRIGIERDRPGVLYYEARFRVLYSWKESPVDSTFNGFKSRRALGGDDHVLTVRTPAWCFTAFFSEWTQYLVYADGMENPFPRDGSSDAPPSEGPFWTSYCDGTTPLQWARYDLLVLGNPSNDYGRPDDSLILDDPMSLSEEEKREVLSSGIWRTMGFNGEVRDRDANGYYSVWFRPNPAVEWAYGGQIDGGLVDDGDWRSVNEALKELGPQLSEVFGTIDWKRAEHSRR
jgi:hypothetical protein